MTKFERNIQLLKILFGAVFLILAWGIWSKLNEILWFLKIR